MDTWSPTLALERFELVRRVWSLHCERGGVRAPQLRLRPDRRLACSGTEAELAGWDVRGDALVLLDRAGVARACFDESEHEGGLTTWQGFRVADGHRTLTLRETAPVEQWPDAAARHAPQPLEELQPRRQLVVAAADGSIDRWVRDLDPADRLWDLCLLGADALPAADEPPEWEASPVGDGRWAALHTLLYPGSPLFRYDHVAFPDRKVMASWAGLNEVFAACHAHDLALAHPTVEAGAPVAARFQPVADRLLGFGTPVELHCPIFSAEALRVCAPTFALSPAGSPELAQLWTALLAASPTRVAVVDGGAPPISLTKGETPPARTPALLARYGLSPLDYDAGALLA